MCILPACIQFMNIVLGLIEFILILIKRFYYFPCQENLNLYTHMHVKNINAHRIGIKNSSNCMNIECLMQKLYEMKIPEMTKSVYQDSGTREELIILFSLDRLIIHFTLFLFIRKQLMYLLLKIEISFPHIHK